MLETIVAIYDRTMSGPHRDRVGYRYKANGSWHDITFGEMDRRVQDLAAALVDLGVQAGDRVALISENRPEWVQVDQAIIRSGGVHVPLYLTLTPKQIAFILNDCRPQIVFTANAALTAKVLEACQEADSVTHVVQLDGEPTGGGRVTLTTLKALMDKGASVREKHAADLAGRVSAITPESMVSIIYTSGTTGNPKGVMLSHRNFATNATTAVTLVDITAVDSCLSFLPLSHVFERVIYYMFLSVGALTNYAESIDTVPQNLAEVSPTFLVSVPRLFEKIRARVLDTVSSGSAVKKALFGWGFALGRKVVEARQVGREVDPFTAAQYKIADKLVFSKVRARTGGKLRFCISGGAPLPKEVAFFFSIVGITLLEGYGLTESSPVICVNTPAALRLGTVGRPMPGNEVKIAEDGEILARGPNIMMGYFNNEHATREVLDADGWLYTGDIGELDQDGFLKITDRKKEILVMSNGKNVAPAPIENSLVLSPYIAQAMLIGDNRNYISALVVPNFEGLKRVIAEKGWPTDPAALAALPELKALLRAEVDRQTKDFARFEQIKEFIVLGREFSMDLDELSPKMSMKRRNILKHNAEAIEGLYATSKAPVA